MINETGTVVQCAVERRSHLGARNSRKLSPQNLVAESQAGGTNLRLFAAHLHPEVKTLTPTK
jgi:hypothetical protein